MSTGTRDVLDAFGYLTHTGGRLYRLHELSMVGRSLPDLNLRVSPVASQLRLEMMLGLNFLQEFTEICFDREERCFRFRA